MSFKLLVSDDKLSINSLQDRLKGVACSASGFSIVSIRIPDDIDLFHIMSVMGILFKFFNGHPKVLFSRRCVEIKSIEITFFSSLSELLEETQV